MSQAESQQIRALKERYKTSFPEKITLLKAQCLAIESGAGDMDGFAEAHEVLHKLAGSSGMYGYDDVSNLCRETMVKLDQSDRTYVVAALHRVIALLQQHC